jgi:hypothetical protein
MDALGEIGSDIGSDFQKRNTNVGQIKADVQSGKKSLASGLFESVGQAAGMVGDAALDVVKPAIKPEVKEGIKSGLSTIMQTPAAQGLAKAWGDFETAHPELAGNIKATGNIASLLPILRAPGEVLGLAGRGIDTVGTVAADTAKASVAPLKTGAQAVKTGVQATKNAVKSAPKVEDTISAIDPDLSGKKAVAAYKQIATGGREGQEAGVISKQGVTPANHTIESGIRLHGAGITFGKDPLENLGKIRTAFTDTESKIDKALTADPEITYNANKPGLATTLEKLRTAAPRETLAIKDSKKAFGDVVSYARQLLSKVPDDVKGIRQMRQLFDNGARKEYPSAFSDGMIDTKSPAGQAIKQVRDTINAHLYQTAPEGSEVQRLTKLETDLYRAQDAIAPKAAKLHGKGIVGKFFANHPGAGKVIRTAAHGAGLGAGIHLVP